VTGIPAGFHYHPFRYIDWKEEARIQKQAAQRSAERTLVGNSVFGFRFLGRPEFGIPLPTSEFRNFPAENQIGKPENRSSRKSEFRFPFSGFPEFR
jgi:hypothetical protein